MIKWINKALVLIALNLLTPSVNADEIIKNCIGGEVRSIDVSTEVVPIAPANAKPETIEIVTTKGKTTGVIARGPVLGSMDSPTVKTELECTAKGFVLTATITRSANYHGAVRQNENWWPKITIAVAPQQFKIAFQTIWEMRLTTGVKVDHAQTPPYPERKYPITLTKTIRSVLTP